LTRSRLLLYAPNGYGLGHLSRQVALARALRQADPAVEILFATESSYGPQLGPEFPFIGIPASRHTQSEAWTGPGARRRAAALAAMIDGVVEAYRPGAVIHDTLTWPPLFEAASRAGARHAMVIRRRKNLAEHLADPALPPLRCHLWVLPYAREEAADILANLPAASPPVACVGAVARQAGTTVAATRARMGVREGVRLILVTAGAGGFPDAESFYERALAGLAAVAPVLGPHLAVVVLGPAYSGAVPVVAGVNAYVWRDVAFMTDLLAAADLVVCQGGHNTIAELLSAGVPGVIVPAARNIDDQWRRAREAAAGSDVLAVVEDPGTDLGPVLRGALTRRRTAGPKDEPPLDFDELRRVVALGEVSGSGDEAALPRMSDVNHHR